MARRNRKNRSTLSKRERQQKRRNRRNRGALDQSLFNQTTNGGEFTLEDGTPYVGDYHIMPDGTPMTGAQHKGRGFAGLRRRKRRSKLLIPVTTRPSDTTADTTPPPTTTPAPVKPPEVNRPPVRIPPKPPKVDLSGIITQPYKRLENYGNQYPATDSSVRDAADTNISSYYLRGVFASRVMGHISPNREAIPTQNFLRRAEVRSELNIDFILRLDGKYYTSAQQSAKIKSAEAEGNTYYINSVPVIRIDTARIKPYVAKGLFKTEEDYSFNPPSNQIDTLSEILDTIDWVCRKTAALEQPRPYGYRYDDRTAVAARLDMDAVIASANKPPKIRWRQS